MQQQPTPQQPQQPSTATPKAAPSSPVPGPRTPVEKHGPVRRAAPRPGARDRQPTPSRPGIGQSVDTRNDWPRRLSALVGTSLIVPVLGEFVIAIINKEQFNLTRALVFVGVLGGCALGLLSGRLRQVSLRLAMAAFLIVAGVATVAFGFLLAVAPTLIHDDTVSDVVGIITLSVGLFILSAGLLLLYEQRGATTVTHELVDPMDATGTGAQHAVLRRFPPYRAEAYDGLVELCRAALDSRDLHYVAFYANQRPVFQLDVLNDPALARFYGLVGPQERRASYEGHGRTVHHMMTKLNAQFRSLDSGSLIRLVLDVERGALYYYIVHAESQRFLIGVTLDQDMVHVTDHKLQLLVDDVRHYLGHPRITDLERRPNG